MLNAKLKPVWSGDERGAARYRLLIEASADVSDAGTQAVSIHQLSATGFLLEAQDDLPVGTEVDLDIPGAGQAQGEVVWSFGRFAGGQFRSPLTPDTLKAARSGSRVVWPEFVPTSAADRAAEIVEPATVPHSDETVANDRWPLRKRVQLIVGASMLLWTPVALAIWVAVS